MENSTILSNWTIGNKQKVTYDFSCELYRMSTHSAFPTGVPVSERSLAHAGFYYTHVNNKVKCFCCGLMLDNWKQGDNPFEKHKQLYPSCSFIQNLVSVTNLESTSKNASSSMRNSFTYSLSATLEHSSSFSGSYSNLSRNSITSRAVEDFSPLRTDSYSYAMTLETFPQLSIFGNSLEMLRFSISNLSMQTHALANAGFYYVGRNDDVKYFCCDGGLRCWESGDDPWFLICTKGQVFVDEIQARYPYLLEQLLSTSDTPGDENAVPPIVYFGPGKRSSDDVVMMNLTVVKTDLEIGFSRRLVKRTVQSKILTTGESYKTVNDTVLALLIAEDEKREEKEEETNKDKMKDKLKKQHQMICHYFGETEWLSQWLMCVLPILDKLLKANVINKQDHDITKCASNIFKNCLKEIDPTLYKNIFVEKNMKYIPTDVSALSLEEQLRRLQEERTCKVCMGKEVSIVFIPCGHLVVCWECAPSLRKCPICRGITKGTVCTFCS
ncbi:hypothetical protein FD755_003081 [Muntiacus reevesi]|uniref:RING-type domain-containing protein n=1 Tax=Muntiacus reevesi TaxID=9886 RepID=A0A5J5N657_MUNRE|nr:hypothetical protein FD755_003081 [Muntiacus reevesi]